jgi:hypothetical protein
MLITPCYYLLLGYEMPRLCMIRGNDLINIEDNGIVCTIIVTKHLDNNIKCL